jgi:hypothetical protein
LDSHRAPKQSRRSQATVNYLGLEPLRKPTYGARNASKSLGRLPAWPKVLPPPSTRNMSVDNTSRAYDSFQGISTQRQKVLDKNHTYCVTIIINRISQLRAGNSRATICRCETCVPQTLESILLVRAPSGSPLTALGTSRRMPDDSQQGQNVLQL